MVSHAAADLLRRAETPPKCCASLRVAAVPRDFTTFDAPDGSSASISGGLFAQADGSYVCTIEDHCSFVDVATGAASSVELRLVDDATDNSDKLRWAFAGPAPDSGSAYPIYAATTARCPSQVRSWYYLDGADYALGAFRLVCVSSDGCARHKHTFLLPMLHSHIIFIPPTQHRVDVDEHGAPITSDALLTDGPDTTAALESHVDAAAAANRALDHADSSDGSRGGAAVDLEEAAAAIGIRRRSKAEVDAEVEEERGARRASAACELVCALLYMAACRLPPHNNE